MYIVFTLKGLLNKSQKKKKNRGHQVLKSGEIAHGEIFRGGVRNLLDEKLLQQFCRAKGVMEQGKKCIRLTM
jgi:hypothetical protein